MLVDQAEALRSLASETDGGGRRARLVAVTSGKGGVGKTTVAVNLAIRLSAMGRRVVLFDADLGMANADVLCNVTAPCTLAHVVAGRRSLEDAIVEAPGGFRLVPGASGLARIASLSEFERSRLLQELRRLEADSDLILIDTAAGLSPNVLSFALGSDQLLVVTTPEPTAITDAYAIIKTLRRQRSDLEANVLVNMVRDADEGRAVFGRIDAVCRRFLELNVRYAGHVVHDARVMMAVRHRRPFVLENPHGDAARCVTQLAHRMDRHAIEQPTGPGLIRRMASWLAG
jgi:flagellar biosynthesis protein FlhG